MAEPEVVIEEDIGDEDMAEAGGNEADPFDDAGPTGLEDIEPIIAERTTFLEYAFANSSNSIEETY